MRKISASLAVALSVAVVGVAFAGEPVHREIPYTKKVSLYTPKTYTFHFSIYEAATDGTELWYEERSVRLTSKTLTHNLGSVISFADAGAGPLDFSEQYWIQVSYWYRNAWKPLGTRDKLTASPYALGGVNPGPRGPQGDVGPQGPPGPSGNLALAGQQCRGGQIISGYDVAGNIVCTWTVFPYGFPSAYYKSGSFKNANLSGAGLGGLDLSDVDFSFSNLMRASGENVKFIGANLTGALLQDSNFRGDFSNANLSGANLMNSEWYNVILNGADFSNVILTSARLGGVHGMESAVLTGVIWSSTQCPDQTYSDTNGTAPESCEGHLTPQP